MRVACAHGTRVVSYINAVDQHQCRFSIPPLYFGCVPVGWSALQALDRIGGAGRRCTPPPSQGTAGPRNRRWLTPRSCGATSCATSCCRSPSRTYPRLADDAGLFPALPPCCCPAEAECAPTAPGKYAIRRNCGSMINATRRRGGMTQRSASGARGTLLAGVGTDSRLRIWSHPLGLGSRSPSTGHPRG